MKAHPKHRMILICPCFCPCGRQLPSKLLPLHRLYLCSSSFKCQDSQHRFGVNFPFAKSFATYSFHPFLTHRGQWPSHCCQLGIVSLPALLFQYHSSSSPPPPKLPSCPLEVWATVVSRHLMLASWWKSSPRSLAGEAVTSLHAILGPARPLGSQASTPPIDTKKQDFFFRSMFN